MTTIIPRIAAVFLACIIVVPATSAAAGHTLHTFNRIQLSDRFWSEGAHFGDFNKDGKMDIVSGPYWWQGPDFLTRREYRPALKGFKLKQPDGSEKVIPGFKGALSGQNDYSDNFLTYTHDFNQDGWDDILILGFPGRESWWFENPQGRAGHWNRHTAVDVTDNESPTFGDLTGDGRPEVIFHSRGFLGYAEPDWDNPTNRFVFHKISPKGNWQRFTHGYGYGDVNGDNRMDILEKNGWWEQPASLQGDPLWKFHKVNLGKGGAQMYAYDVNGDGRNDIITSLEAHQYGLAWYEQLPATDAAGSPKFKQHIFMNKEPGENRYGVKFSQPHALDLADMDGDGLKDIITGKRFWAHGPSGDSEPNAPAVLYWFKLARDKSGNVDFIPYLIDDDSGIGTQVQAGDVNGDGHLDVVVGNKKGTFVHLQNVKQASQEEWEQAQPKLFQATD